MHSARRRLLVVVLGVVAVALAAALLPSAGVGSTPGLDAGSGPESGAGPGSGAGDGPGADGAADVPTSTPTPAPTDSSDAPGTPQVVETPTPRDADETPTPREDDDSDRDEGASLLTLPVVGAVAVVFFAGLAVVLFAGGPTGASGRWSAGGVFDGDGDGGAPSLSPSTVAKRIPQATMVALVGVSTLTARVFERLGALGRAVGTLFRAVGNGSGSAVESVLGGFGRALRNPPSLGLGASLAGITGTLAALSVGGADSRPSTQGTDGRVASPVEPTAADEAEEVEPPRTVTGAWEELTGAVPLRDPESRTPGEYARAAVSRGLPTTPVRRLTRVFRRVRYGDVPPSDEDTETAIEAALRIRSEASAEDDATAAGDAADDHDEDGENG